MSHYRLLVFHAGAAAPSAHRTVPRAAEVVGAIEALLRDYPDCHRIRVEGLGGFLFAVDCNGRTVIDAGS